MRFVFNEDKIILQEFPLRVMLFPFSFKPCHIFPFHNYFYTSKFTSLLVVHIPLVHFVVVVPHLRQGKTPTPEIQSLVAG
jgi:hypothetical protein